MRVTDKAIKAILKIMRKQQLDPEKVYFEIKLLDNGAVGVGFSYNREGDIRQYGELRTTISPGIDMSDVVIDYGKTDDREGILFLKENTNVN